MKLSKTFLAVLFFLSSLNTQGATWEFSTQFSQSSQLVLNPAVDELPKELGPPEYLLNERLDLRLMADVYLSDAWFFQGHYLGGIAGTLARGEGDEAFSTGLSSGSSRYRIDDLDPEPGDLGDLGGLEALSYQQNLDRFLMGYSFAWGDLTLGRQAITFGSARFIKPTDIFTPQGLAEFPSDYRPGVDALRLEIPLGELDELDLGWLFSPELEDSATYARWRINRRGVDITTTGIRNESQSILGLGFEGSLGEWGWNQEWALLTASEESDIRASLGFDKTQWDILWMVEYHWNQAGESHPDNYLDTLTTHPFYQNGSVVLLGRQYVSLAGSWLAGVRSTVNGQINVNLNDGSWLSTNYWGWSINQDWDLGLQLTVAQGANPVATESGYLLQSEFGTFPSALHLQFNRVF